MSHMKTLITIVPAQAGTYAMLHLAHVLWVPACAGTTRLVDDLYEPCDRRLKVIND